MKSKPDETPRKAEQPGAGQPHLTAIIETCRADGSFLAAIAAVYTTVDAAVAARGWVCKACGACCDFAVAGHRLYASGGELALLAQGPAPLSAAVGRCPYLADAKCAAHERRTLGCRLFFCDPASRQWSAQSYETYHGEIRRLHEAHALPYAYAELTGALAELFRPHSRDRQTCEL